MLFLDAGSAWGRGLGKLAMQLCRSWWKAQEIAPRWTPGTVVGSWWQLMAVDSSCQAVLEVQAQDLICLSPCQSGEDCLGLTAKTPRPNLLLLGFPQIPLPSDSIGMSRDQVKWLCVYLALCFNMFKLLEVSFSPLVLSCVWSFDESSKHYKRGTSLHSVPPQLWRWGTRDVRWQTWSLGGCQATRIIAGVATISEVEQMAFLRNSLQEGNRKDRKTFQRQKKHLTKGKKDLLHVGVIQNEGKVQGKPFPVP